MTPDRPIDRSPPPGFVPPPPPPILDPAAPPPPPGLVLTPPAGAASPAADQPPAPAGYTHSWGLTLSPRVVAWLPAVLLTITFLTTFFPWVGSYLGGYPVYSQSPWRALFGSVSRNLILETYLPGDRSWLDNLPSDWEVMIPYILLLLAAVALAWADRGVGALDPRRVPPLAQIWPWRKAVISGLAGLAFFLLLVQTSRGFGMERAIWTMVRDNPELVKAREQAGTSQAKMAVVENRAEQELARFNLDHTIWYRLGLTCNLLAVLTTLLSIGLDRRGDRPPPKILLHY